MGIAPMYNSFADCCLATWLPGHISFLIILFVGGFLKTFLASSLRFVNQIREILTTAMVCMLS